MFSRLLPPSYNLVKPFDQNVWFILLGALVSSTLAYLLLIYFQSKEMGFKRDLWAAEATKMLASQFSQCTEMNDYAT